MTLVHLCGLIFYLLSSFRCFLGCHKSFHTQTTHSCHDDEVLAGFQCLHLCNCTGVLQHPDGTILKQLQAPPRGPREMNFYTQVTKMNPHHCKQYNIYTAIVFARK